MDNRKISQYLALWAVDLPAFDFLIEYNPGHLNVAPEALICRENLTKGGDTYTSYNTRTVLQPQNLLAFMGTRLCESSLDYEIQIA